MKKIVSLLICSLIISTTGCNNKNKKISGTFNDNLFSYNIENSCAFTVENDILYASFADDNTIKSYNNSGELLETYYLNEGVHTNLSYYNNKIYCFSYGEDGNYITIYDLKEKKLENHKLDLDVSSALSMTVAKDKAYIVYWSEHSDAYLESVKYSDDDSYIYMGEKSAEINLTDFSIKEIPIDNVLNLKPYSENEIIYYAYDDIGGYYTTVYNIETKEFNKKTYNNTPQYTYAFDYYKGNIIFSDFNCKKISSVSMNDPDVQIDFMPNVLCTSGNDLKIENGKCYALDYTTGNVFRVSYDDTVKENKEIILYSSEVYSEVPYSCGYRINSSIHNNEEFAMNILAENSNYDICMISSGQTISQNIRDRGAFYKLNDIPAVNEYLDKCFPYLKEAAYNENGDIWMIPIAVDIPCIVYNPKNCQKYGIDINDKISWQKFIDICKNAYEYTELRDKFEANGYQIQNEIMDRYNNFYSIHDGKSDYNNELFRDICSMLKKTDINSNYLHTRIIALDHYHDLNEYYNDYLFEYMNYLYDVFYSEAFSSLRAIPSPAVYDEKSNCASCIFFCVNSNSDNLEETLNFINTYCSYMLTRNDNYLLNDKSIYPFNDTPLANDLFNIYSNATVHFTPSYEMFWQDYIKYQNNEITLDTLITEIERKTNMYLNE